MTDSELNEKLNNDFRAFRIEHDSRIAQKYVEQIPGKGLSEENFTPQEKNKLASLTGGADIDTSQFATKTELQTAVDNVTIDTSLFATKTEMQTAVDNVTIDTSQFATKTELQTVVDNVTVDTSQFATKADLETISGGSTGECTLPTASSYEKGGVMVTGNDGLYMDGDTLKTDAGGIDYGVGLEYSGTSNTVKLKTASSREIGGVKVTGNDGLYIDNGTLKLDGNSSGGKTIYYDEGLESWHDEDDYPHVRLEEASSSELGGVKVTGNDGLYMGSEGNLSLKAASADEIGGVKVTGNDGLYMDGDTLKADTGGGGGGGEIQCGSGLGMDSSGVIELQRASADEIGGVIVTGNDGLYMDGDTLKADFSSLIVNGKLQIVANGTTYTFSPD